MRATDLIIVIGEREPRYPGAPRSWFWRVEERALGGRGRVRADGAEDLPGRAWWAAQRAQDAVLRAEAAREAAELPYAEAIARLEAEADGEVTP